MLAVAGNSFSQTTKSVSVFLDRQHVSASADADNSANQLNLYSNTPSAAMLKVLNPGWQKEKDWKRSFEIFDSTDKSLLKIPAANQLSYQVSVKQLRSLLKRGSVYSIYTMAVPKDPKVAATVRVRRILVCRINVK